MCFPPRPLEVEEAKELDEWLGRAGDISSAYVSRRHSDDPAVFNRIVISAASDNRPTHVVHAPLGMNVWVKLTVGQDDGIEVFDNLREAMNSIRPVLKVT